MAILQWLGLDGLHPLLAWGLVIFYVAFAVWAIGSFVVWAVRKSAGRVDADGLSPPAQAVKPAFMQENVEEKQEILEKADAYVNPADARAAAVAAPNLGLLEKASRLTGLLVAVLGLLFVLLLIYVIVVRPKGGESGFLSQEAWKAVLASHWVVLVFMAIRTVVALYQFRAKAKDAV